MRTDEKRLTPLNPKNYHLNFLQIQYIQLLKHPIDKVAQAKVYPHFILLALFAGQNRYI